MGKRLENFVTGVIPSAGAVATSVMTGTIGIVSMVCFREAYQDLQDTSRLVLGNVFGLLYGSIAASGTGVSYYLFRWAVDAFKGDDRGDY